MHINSMRLMRGLFRRLPDKKLKILDVGSRLVEGQENVGTYRQLINKKWIYIGVDIESGENVDVLMEEYKIPFKDESFDVVISGQTLEHVEFPWELMKEMARVLKKGGEMYVIAPAKVRLHRYPIDTFRYYPDGMIALCKWAGLKALRTRRSQGKKQEQDTYLIATK